MFVRSIDPQCEEHCIQVDGDNFLLLSMLLSPACLSIARSYEGIFGALISILGWVVGLAMVALFAIAVGGLRRFKLYRSGYTQAPNELKNLVEQVHRESPFKLRLHEILWCPTNLGGDVHVFGFVNSGGIAFSGNLGTAGLENPQALRPIVVHELAHLHNRDFLLIPAGAFVLAGLFLAGMDDIGSQAFIATIVQVPFLWYLLFRREYIADAMAVQECQRADEYFPLILGKRLNDVRLHPSALSRVRALTSDHPILRRSYIIITFAVLHLAAIADQCLAAILPQDPNYILGQGYVEPARSPLLWVLAWSVLAAAPSAYALMLEWVKGSDRKRPLLLGERPALYSDGIFSSFPYKD